MTKKVKGTAWNYFRFLFGCCGAAALILPAVGLLGRSAAARPIPGPAPQAAAAQAAKPSLAGTWKLNKDQSDDPRQKMQQAMGSSGDGQGQGNGNGGGNGAGRPGRGQGGPGGPGGGGMMTEWAQLTVTQLDANVKITGASGRVLATTTPPDAAADSKSDADASNSGGSGGGGGQGGARRTPPVAQWQGSQLVTAGRGFGGGGGGTTRTYELSPDGKQLIVTTKITNERLTQPVTYRLVYDSEKSGGSNQ
jgi:hypothetical protein